MAAGATQQTLCRQEVRCGPRPQAGTKPALSARCGHSCEWFADGDASTGHPHASTARCCRGRRVTDSVRVPRSRPPGQLLLYLTPPVTRRPRQQAPSQRAKVFKTRRTSVVAALRRVAVWSEVKGEAWAKPRPEDSAPSMDAIFGVQVPGRAGHSEASEAQLREGDRAWGGSVERNLRADEQELDVRRRRPGRAGCLLQSSCGQRPGDVNAAVVRRRIVLLPGEISPHA